MYWRAASAANIPVVPLGERSYVVSQSYARLSQSAAVTRAGARPQMRERLRRAGYGKNRRGQ